MAERHEPAYEQLGDPWTVADLRRIIAGMPDDAVVSAVFQQVGGYSLRGKVSAYAEHFTQPVWVDRDNPELGIVGWRKATWLLLVPKDDDEQEANEMA